jgi:hypothetical protein
MPKVITGITAIAGYLAVHRTKYYPHTNLTDISYMPDYGVGYFFSINSESGDAFEKVGKAVRAYITHSLQKPVVPPVAQLSVNAADYAGWYEPDSPRTELSHFLGRLVRLSRVRFEAAR